MKKRFWCLFWLCCLLCLSGCGAPVPDTAADGSAWDEDWITVGNVIGVETPEGMTFRESSDALDPRGMYYAAWSAGEAVPAVNEDGEDVQIYDAQVYLLLADYASAGKAEEAAAEWLDMATERYSLETTASETNGGQAFTVITYTYASETNPYARGASDFGAYGNYAISIELSSQFGRWWKTNLLTMAGFAP